MVNNSTIIAVVAHLIRFPDHPRSIAKHLGKSHATILLALYELEKQHAVTYVTEGKNKKYTLTTTLQAKTLMLMAEQQKLLITLQRYPELAIITEQLREQTTAEIILLFGSYAKHVANKHSDIDVYVNTSSVEEKKTLQRVHSKLSIQTGILDSKSALGKEIIKDHVILKGAENYYERIHPQT